MSFQEHACPKCKRRLKPMMVEGKITLGCRYCNYHVAKEEREKTPVPRPKPSKCPDCEGKNVIFDEEKDGDTWWKCKDCDFTFQWEIHKAVFAVEVEYASMPEEAEEIAWLMFSSDRHEHVELMGYWEDGKHDACFKFTKEERTKRCSKT